jgi:predicted aldo/keto reductase-like oxidoreductase
MEKVRLGRTGLMVSRSSFGALPIQRVSFEEAKKLLLTAYLNGMNLFDTARMYSDSEEKIGHALKPYRKEIFIATKTHATDLKTFHEHLDTSLKNMKTDYIDIYQIHHPKKLPDPNDQNGLYQALVRAKQKGVIRFIGISSHRQDITAAAISSGLYDTLQYPLNSLSDDKDIKIAQDCRDRDIGFIAMKPMSGGLLLNARASFAFLRQYSHVVPIWGVQKDSELKEILALEKRPPFLSREIRETIEKDRAELSGNFCRACGYCLPCPVEIPIPMAARMSLLLRRMPWQQFMSDDWQKNMQRIEACTECGDCKKRCPYGLDTPALLKEMLEDYLEFRKEKNL